MRRLPGRRTWENLAPQAFCAVLAVSLLLRLLFASSPNYQEPTRGSVVIRTLSTIRYSPLSNTPIGFTTTMIFMIFMMGVVSVIIIIMVTMVMVAVIGLSCS